MSEMMKMAGQLREQMAQTQAKAESLRVTGEAGGGLVRVTMDGARQVLEVDIDASLWGQADDRSLAEDLVRAAFNAANFQVEEKLRGPVLGDIARGMGLDPNILAGHMSGKTPNRPG